MQLLIMYSLYRKLFDTEDKTLFKKIWSLQKLCPIIILYNNLWVNAGNFLVNICPLRKKATLDPKDIKLFLAEQTRARNEVFPAQMNLFYLKLVQWVVKMNSDHLKDSSNMCLDKEFLKVRANLIGQGVNLANEIKRTLKNLILMHNGTGVQLQQERLKDIVQGIEMLKAIEIEFKTKKYMINQWVVLMNRFLSEEINIMLEKGMDNLYRKKKSSSFDNMFYLMKTIIGCFNGGYNLLRKTVVTHCKNLLNDDVFSKNELLELETYTWKIDVIANWEGYMQKATRCRFLYWVRSLFPLLFQRINGDKQRLNQLNFFLMALNDPLDMLVNIRHLASSQVAIDNYKQEIYSAFSREITLPLCRKVEEELRVQIH